MKYIKHNIPTLKLMHHVGSILTMVYTRLLVECTLLANLVKKVTITQCDSFVLYGIEANVWAV